MTPGTGIGGTMGMGFPRRCGDDPKQGKHDETLYWVPLQARLGIEPALHR